MDGKECEELNTDAFDGKAFFDMMRAGKRITTSQINPHSYSLFFEKYLAAGNDILFVSMSSGISGSFQSARIGAELLKEKYPERKVVLIDSRGASLGEGLLAVMAVDCADRGMALGETEKYMNHLCDCMYNVFTVDELKYLRMTGRLCNAAAVVGMVLQIKPILKGDEQGRIVSFRKVRGRQHAIEMLAQRYEELAVEPEKQIVGIAHADCEEDADRLARLLMRNRPPKEIMKVMYEPVTGSHVGPGTLALFFLSDENCRSR